MKKPRSPNIIFIGCGKKKCFHECEAQDMYQGQFFRTCLAYAKTFNCPIYILSAKYGILSLTDKITPYDQTLNKMTKQEKQVWYQKVIQQFQNYNISKDNKAIFLCGKNYNEGLLDYFNDYEIPLSKFTGMGYQISYMQSHTKRKLF